MQTQTRLEVDIDNFIILVKKNVNGNMGTNYQSLHRSLQVVFQ